MHLALVTPSHDPLRPLRPRPDRNVCLGQLDDDTGGGWLVRGVEASLPTPSTASQIEGAHHKARRVHVPDFERRGNRVGVGTGARAGGIDEECILRRSSGTECNRYRSVGKDELAEQVVVMVARLIARVDGAAAHRTRSSVHGSGGMARVEHVPVHVHDLTHENAVRRNGSDVPGLGCVVLWVEIVTDPCHGCVTIVVKILRTVAHAVDAVFGTCQ